MNLVLIGTTGFSYKCLKLLETNKRINICGIISANKKFKISYSDSEVHNIFYKNLDSYAKEKSIKIYKINKYKDCNNLHNAIKDMMPDLFIVVGWYHYIPKKWRNIAPCFALHASLLPDYSGGAPLVWSIINGEEKTGITLFKMDDGIDTGPIIGKKEEIISKNDTILTLYNKIEKLGLKLIEENIKNILDHKIKYEMQNESKRRIMPQRSPRDGIINWKNSSIEIDRFIRAQTKPYPGAFSYYKNHKLHIWKCQLYEHRIMNLSAGYVFQLNDKEYLVKCGTGLLRLVEVTYKKITYFGKDMINIFGHSKQLLTNKRLINI